MRLQRRRKRGDLSSIDTWSLSVWLPVFCQTTSKSTGGWRAFQSTFRGRWFCRVFGGPGRRPDRRSEAMRGVFMGAHGVFNQTGRKAPEKRPDFAERVSVRPIVLGAMRSLNGFVLIEQRRPLAVWGKHRVSGQGSQSTSWAALRWSLWRCSAMRSVRKNQTHGTHTGGCAQRSVSRSKPQRGPKEVAAGSKWGPSTEFIVTPDLPEWRSGQSPSEIRSLVVMRLYEACSLRVYAFLRRSLPADAAEDLTQETFLRLLQLRNLEKKSISISYLFRVAQNLVRRRYNVAARSRAFHEKVLRNEVEFASKVDDPNAQLVALEAEHLGPAIETLVPHERETIRLIVCEGLSYSDAARILQVPVSTVNNWKHRALRKLRGFIDAINTDSESNTSRQPTADIRRNPSRSSTKQDSCSQATRATHSQLQAADVAPSGRLRTRVAG